MSKESIRARQEGNRICPRSPRRAGVLVVPRGYGLVSEAVWDPGDPFPVAKDAIAELVEPWTVPRLVAIVVLFALFVLLSP